MINYQHIRLVLIVLQFAFVSLFDEINLSTASVRASTSPKPSSLYRRINVERISENTSTTQFDLFKAPDHGWRRSRHSQEHRVDKVNAEIWSWDYWCLLQKRIGNCDQKLVRYYYEVDFNQCANFTYSGCNGNKNSFDSIEQCDLHCNGAAFLSMDESLPNSFCELQPSSGVCMALIPAFYYDVNAKECKEFTYGGCGGNQNRFESMATCIRACRGT